jgi:O-antigen/teichoic acid export membrane protein
MVKRLFLSVALLSIALNFALIPPFGRMGAAFATVAAFARSTRSSCSTLCGSARR